ncbi:hypothetical protein ACLOJK_026383 [Asimina triloba]
MDAPDPDGETHRRGWTHQIRTARRTGADGKHRTDGGGQATPTGDGQAAIPWQIRAIDGGSVVGSFSPNAGERAEVRWRGGARLTAGQIRLHGSVTSRLGVNEWLTMACRWTSDRRPDQRPDQRQQIYHAWAASPQPPAVNLAPIPRHQQG